MFSFKSKLARNLVAVASGAAAGQAVAFAFSPLITRIYDPVTFGIQGVFLSLVSIFSPAIALRYPLAIVVADEREVAPLGQLSLAISFVMACATMLVLVVAEEPILALLGAENLGYLILFLPLALFCVALQDVFTMHVSRAGNFRAVGTTTVAQSLLTNIVRVLGGLYAPVAATLVSITTVAPGIQAAMLSNPLKWRRANWTLSLAGARELLGKYWDFPIYRVPTDMLNAASQAIPVILLAAMFSPAAAGFYVLTRSALNLPTNVVGAAIGNVLYARFAELARESKPLMPFLFRSTAALLALAPPTIALAWFAPPVFAFVFGEEWREAGYYARWMALWTSVSIAYVPAVRVAPVIKAQSFLLWANVATLIARTIVMIGIYWSGGGALDVVIGFSIVSFFSSLVLIAVLTFKTRQFERRAAGA